MPIKGLSIGVVTVYLLIVPTYLSYIGNGASTTAIIVGIFSILSLNFDKLSSFHLLGLMQAKMKEADKAIKDAYASVDHMHQLAIDLGKTILFTLNEMGKWPDDMDSVKKIAERNRVVSRLKSIGLDSNKISDTVAYFDSDITSHLAHDFCNILIKENLKESEEIETIRKVKNKNTVMTNLINEFQSSDNAKIKKIIFAYNSLSL